MTPDPPEPPSKFQLRVKAGTAVITALTAAFLLLHDWDRASGHPTVFSGVRPAVKRALNRLYGVEGGEGAGEGRR